MIANPVERVPSLSREKAHVLPHRLGRVRPPAFVVLLALALPLPAFASEPSVVVLDWTGGAFLVGGPTAVDGVNAAAFNVTVDACHRDLRVDLQYAPSETGADAPGVGEAALLHTFRAQLLANGSVARTVTITQPGYGFVLGPAPAGAYQLRLQLTQGANVSWSLRLRGWEMSAEPACLPRVVLGEVEQNPPGVDAGAEWVELWNQESVDVDVSGWSVGGTHGTASDLALPAGTVVPAGGRLVVTFPTQALDNVDEVVELRVFGLVRDASPLLQDAANDSRTWQRGDPWVFATGTPGS